MTVFLGLALFAALIAFFVAWSRWRMAAREEYIRTFTLPSGLLNSLVKRHPDLRLKDQHLVARALRQFFLAHLKSGQQFVSMPSQVVDDLWHEFILYTRHYDEFCRNAFGQFLHHTPAVVLSEDKKNNAGLRRVWWHACREENINPKSPTRLPLIFAIDDKLKIKDGFHYKTDCSGLVTEGDKRGSASSPYCAGDMSSTSFDGSTDGLGDDGGSGGDGGDGGGCGGD